MGSRTTVDRPLAVVDGVNTTPVTWWVHVDHLNRPIKMTDGARVSVWTAVWAPWGAPSSITGPATLDARLPGQWFQLEAGLHYNWHRHYDPSLGRYIEPDPLGFVDGPGVYAYARNSPFRYVDRDGRYALGVPAAKEFIEMCLALAAWYFAPPPPPIQPPPEEDRDCERARRFHLERAEITDEHEFKREWAGTPVSRFDICACKKGSIRIRKVGQCGTSGDVDILTTARWAN